MTGLYKRHKIWWIRFTPTPGAAQTRISTGESDESQAIIAARKIIQTAAIEAREQIQSCEHEIALFIHAQKAKGLSESTWRTHEYTLKLFARDLAVAKPSQITTPAIQKWLNERLELHENTAVAYMRTVNQWFRFMLKTPGKLPANPVNDCVIPKVKMRMRKKFLLPAECQLLMGNCQDPSLKFAMYCALHAGLRKLEIIEAKPDWFDLDAGLLHVQATPTFQPKDRDNRTIPLTDEFKNWIINDYGLKSPFMLEPKVKHGKYKYRFDFRKRYESYVRACGFHWLTFHDLRRTFASLHVSKGTSVYKVAAWLGDELKTVETHYGHLIPNDDQINAIWSPKRQAVTHQTGHKGSRPAATSHPKSASPLRFPRRSARPIET